MGNIVLLDDLTINKIAAGEVIERPASAVKELVENSIDAGATNITIEIKNGGISYIRITDNGKGILPDDMEIAFERHATSKIRVAQDIETVKSMGFRGEALASIAAIAKVTMKSKTEQNEIGSQIIIEGGNVIEKGEIGCPNGTSITIENLFFNTPVRYKFLKKDFTEAGYIEDTITRIALAHPEISIKYINTGKTIISTSGNGNMKTVIYAIYGKDIAENVLNVDYVYEDVKVSGVVGKPEIARSNRSNQLFFVNKRYIKDKILTVASMEAFKNLIPVGKYGFLVLNIEVNPAKVDVNVHPAKLEVRFQEEQNVYKAVYNAMRNALGEFENVPKDMPKQGNSWNIATQYNGYGTAPSYINSKINSERNFEYEGNWNKIGAENVGINKIQNDDSEKQKGLFKRFLNKKEKEDEPTIIEQLYEARKHENVSTYSSMDNLNGIMQKMAEMQKSVREFNESQGNEKNGEKIENTFAETERKKHDEENYGVTSEQTSKLGYEPTIAKVDEQKYGDTLEQTRNLSYGSTIAEATEKKYAEASEQTSKLGYEPTITKVDEQKYEENLEQTSNLGYEPTITKVAEQKYEENLEQTSRLGYEPTIAKVDEQKYGVNLEQTSNLSYEPTTTKATEQKFGEPIAQTNKFDYEKTLELAKNDGMVQELASIVKTEKEPVTEYNTDYNKENATEHNTDYNKENATEHNTDYNKGPATEYNTDYKQEEATESTTAYKQEPAKESTIDHKQEDATNSKQNNFEKMYATIFGTKIKDSGVVQLREEPETYVIPKTQEITNENLSLFESKGENNTKKYKYIGTAFNNYILIELDKELYILNQTVAKQKIIYEDLKQKYENKEEKDTQIMLLPDIINLTEKQMLVVEDNKDIFEKAGFILEEFGQNTIKLTGAPNICMKLDTEKLFLEILEQINKVARTDRQEIEEKMLTTIAFAVARESEPVNSPESVEQIMQKITEQPNDEAIGLEQQVFMRLTKADIEKKFSRR